MQLLHTSLLPAAEFVSLSLLMRQDTTDASAASMGEPLMIVSPLCTISNHGALEALHELHNYLTYVSKAVVASRTSIISSSPQPHQQDRMTLELLQEDDKYVSDLQVFRPVAAGGMGMYYRLFRDDHATITTLSSLIMTSNKNGGRIDAPPGLLGVVLCVGVSGLAYSQSLPSIQYSLSQRINDCIGVLSKIGINDVSAAKSVLASFLLSEDEYRKTDTMIEAQDRLVLLEESKAPMSPIDLIAPMAGRKGGRRSSITNTIKTFSSAPPPPTETQIALPLATGSAEAAKSMTQKLMVLSVAETDTFLRKYELSGQERKATLDLTGKRSKSVKRSMKATFRDADFDNFDYKGPAREAVARPAATAAAVLSPPPNEPTPGRLLAQPKRDTKGKGAAMPLLAGPRGDASRVLRSRRESVSAHGDDDGSDIIRFTASTHEGNSVASQARVQVNVALNEDLSCSYRNSQLSSCNIEGVVQVQVKSNTRASIPFHLYVRDPLSHIAALQENGKFTEDVSDDLLRGEEDDAADRKFTVNIPKADSYFPVFKYKCSAELRPVPIRVQTKVKSDRGFCRVALQISSNPNNTASLTDLTIVMNVPDGVRGETLVTQPAGGVWDDAKKSVVWFVSELGVGEKFQLQARFEMQDGASQDDLSFPVLVRCQCLFAQLTNVEVEVRDVPDLFPADLTMKIARRFRLSHRERS